MQKFFLQAAIGFGAFLETAFFALLFFGIPLLTFIIFIIKTLNIKKREIPGKQLLQILALSFFYALISFFILLVLGMLFIYFFVDLSDS